MSTRASAASLAQAVKDLTFQWHQTQTAWHDSKSQEFERQFLEDLPSHLARALAAMEQIDALVKKVRTACE